MPQFVVDLARSPHAIPVSRAFLCQCVLLSLCAITAFAQYSPYRFDHWTTDNGLPQNTVYDVIQTRDGYLWLTTFDGLARFDGVRFTVFDKSNSKGINSNRFTGLYEARDGTLLIGTEDAGDRLPQWDVHHVHHRRWPAEQWVWAHLSRPQW